MDFQVPELGEGIYEAELVRWLVKPGDQVKRGQALVEVMTDKATMEVPSPFAGTIESVQGEPGQIIKVGSVMLTYAPAGEGASEPASRISAERASRVSAERAPRVSGGRRSDKVAGKPDDQQTRKHRGKEARKQEDKETKEETAPTEQVADEAAPAAEAKPTAAPPPDGAAAGRPERNNFAGTAAGEPLKAAPSVRLMARKLGLDLHTIRGSGPAGRILIGDVTSQLTRQRPQGGPAQPDRRLPQLDLGKPGTRMKLQGLRRLIAEHMSLSKRTIPHYSYVDECEVTDLVRLRASLRQTYVQAGIKLTYLAFVVKAVVGALKEVPLVNASLDEKAGEIVMHDHYHIGFAVATPGGLIVPVIHDADRKDLGQLAREIEQLGEQTRTGKARREDLKGSTFTITSIGNIGGLISAPIINHPEVGILGFGKIVRRPVYDANGNLRPADLVYLSFSFDHRVVDGAIGATFGNAVSRRLQNPAPLIAGALQPSSEG